MTIEVHNGEMSEKEQQAYIDRAWKKYPHKLIDKIDLYIDGDFVDIKYTFGTTPFERIRRITGYLVGTTDRWNNAKRAELKDRTKHGI